MNYSPINPTHFTGVGWSRGNLVQKEVQSCVIDHIWVVRHDRTHRHHCRANSPLGPIFSATVLPPRAQLVPEKTRRCGFKLDHVLSKFLRILFFGHPLAAGFRTTTFHGCSAIILNFAV